MSYKTTIVKRHVECGWTHVTWVEFCEWIRNKRVVASADIDEDHKLYFDDGSEALMCSLMTDGSPGYSEMTPGSDGHLTVPMVFIKEKKP